MAPAALQLAVDVPLLLKNPKAALMPVLRNIPGWGQAQDEAVEVNQISGAMTNLIYRCKFTSPARKVLYALARVYGSSEGLFKREEEQRIFSAVAEVGLGPRLLVNFGNGRIEEFLLDQSISAEQMRSAPIAACIAAAMASFHFCSLRKSTDGLGKPMLWKRIHDWAHELQHKYTPPELRALGLQDIETQINVLERTLSAHHPNWLAFCHNDLQYGNMLLHVSSARSLNRRSDSENNPPKQDNAAVSRSVPDKRDSSPSRLPQQGQHSRPSSRAGSPSARELHESNFQHLPPRAPSYTHSHLADGYASGAELGGDSPKAHQSSLQRPHSFKAHASIDSDSLSEAERVGSLSKSVGRLSMRLIDYEYAGTNPVAFDIANHWCEYAADYHDGAPHMLDYALLPTKEQQLHFVRTYVQAVALMNPDPVPALAQSFASAASLSAKHERSETEAPSFVPCATRVQLHIDEDGFKSPILVGTGSGSHSLAAGCDSNGAEHRRSQAGDEAHNGSTLPRNSPEHPNNSLQAAVLEAEAREGVQYRQSRHGSHNLPDVCSQAERAALEGVVSQLREAAWAYLPASHLLWGLWGYIQARQSEVDFDFMSYAHQRMAQYRALTGQPRLDLS